MIRCTHCKDIFADNHGLVCCIHGDFRKKYRSVSVRYQVLFFFQPKQFVLFAGFSIGSPSTSTTGATYRIAWSLESPTSWDAAKNAPSYLGGMSHVPFSKISPHLPFLLAWAIPLLNPVMASNLGFLIHFPLEFTKLQAFFR